MLEVFNKSLGNGSLPPTLTQAKIILLLLAHRLESVLPKVIFEDQIGFIKGHHSFSNIRRLANVIYSPGPSSTAEAIISLDTEKAFDRVEWKYLFAVLERFGLGDTFLAWIRLLY